MTDKLNRTIDKFRYWAKEFFDLSDTAEDIVTAFGHALVVLPFVLWLGVPALIFGVAFFAGETWLFYRMAGVGRAFWDSLGHTVATLVVNGALLLAL